jgi:hypothetical protein
MAKDYDEYLRRSVGSNYSDDQNPNPDISRFGSFDELRQVVCVK